MRTIVQHCGCTVAGKITVKSAAVKNDMKPAIEVGFATRNNGAAFQDARYGKGNRLFNTSHKDKDNARCSVCGTRKGIKA